MGREERLGNVRLPSMLLPRLVPPSDYAVGGKQQWDCPDPQG